jgi:hypothetical protein
MRQSYDVFRLEADGGVMWLTAAASMAEAEAAARQFAQKSKGSYLIFNQTTRHRTVVESATLLS